MTDHNGRNIARLNLGLDKATKLRHQILIQSGKGLVQQQCLRRGQQGPHQPDPRRLSTRQAGRITITKASHTRLLQRHCYRGRARCTTDIAGQAKGQIIPNAHMREQQRVLE